MPHDSNHSGGAWRCAVGKPVISKTNLLENADNRPNVCSTAVITRSVMATLPPPDEAWRRAFGKPVISKINLLENADNRPNVRSTAVITRSVMATLPHQAVPGAVPLANP